MTEVTEMGLSEFDVLSFDCYGTLIDWESGMMAGLAPLLAERPELTRDQVLEAHARAEATQQAQTPTMRYRDLLAVVYKRLAERWGLHASHEACVAYGRSVADWPAFPDSAAALAYLGGHHRLVILSNVDNESFEASRRKLGVRFDAVFTAEDIGSYKPAAANFEYMIRNLAEMGIARSTILHVAESLFHDHGPANRHGLSNCWIERRHDEEGSGATMDPGDMPRTQFRFDSMAALVEAHRAGRG